jgi:predicted acetyltransferase
MTIDPVTVDEQNYPQVLDLLEICFPDDVREYFDRHHRRDPAHSFSQARALSADGKIVAHVQVFHRDMGYAADTIPYGGISDVATHPDWQRRGLSAKLLDDSIRYMHSTALPLSMLSTGRHSHYARHGWVQIPQSVLHADLPADLPREPGGFIVRPFEPDDLTPLHRQYRRGIADLAGPEARSLPYMAAQMDWLPFHRADVRWEVYARVGHPAGYLRTRPEGDELHVLDLCAPTDDLERLAITRIFRHAADAGCTHVSVPVVSTSRFARTFAETVSAESLTWPHRMLRLNSLRRLLQCIQPTLSSRLRDPLPRSPFALKVGDETVRVEAPGGGVRFSTATGDEPLVEVTPEAFLNLLMGQPDSHRLLVPTGADLQPTASLQLMFPQSGNLTWGADEF